MAAGALVGGLILVDIPESPAQADSPIDCTEAALDAAVAAGGTVYIQCDGSQIDFSRPIYVTKDVTLTSTDIAVQELRSNYSAQIVVEAGATLEMEYVGVEDALRGAIVNNGTLIVGHGSFQDDFNYAAEGGTGAGGAISTTGTATIDSTTFDTDTASGANGGSGAPGAASVGDGGAYGKRGANGHGDGSEGSPGGIGGTGATGPAGISGGPGTDGAPGEGGAVYSTGTLEVTNSTFSNGIAGGGEGGNGGTGGSSYGGTGGTGGKGGRGGASGGSEGSYPGIGGWGGNGGTGGSGGSGGTGGRGGSGGAGYGGALYVTGPTTLGSDGFYENSAIGGFGGSGGNGGDSYGGGGGSGGNGGKGGDNNGATGDGGAGGAGGSGGNGGMGGTPGDGGHGGRGGDVSGAAIYASGVAIRSLGDITFSGSKLEAGQGWPGGKPGSSHAGKGSAGGRGGAGGTGSPTGFAGIHGSSGLRGTVGQAGPAGSHGGAGASGSQGSVDVQGRFTGPPQAFVTADNFSQVPVGQEATATVTVESSGYRNLDVSSDTLSGSGDFTISNDTCSGASLARGSSCTLDVDVTPSSNGPIYTTLTISDNTRAGQEQAVFTEGALHLVVSPSAPHFGSITVGSSRSEKITFTNPNPPEFEDSFGFRNVDGSGFSAVSTTCFGGQLEWGAEETLKGGRTCSIEVEFSPSITGAQRGSLNFDVNNAGDPPVISLVGTGA